jgi:hypothetical protein
MRNLLQKCLEIVLIATSTMWMFGDDMAATAQKAIASLADGKYQFCSKPQLSDQLDRSRNWQSKTGVCFSFTKIGDRVDGYYAYPNTDDLICLRGQVQNSIVKGESLAVSWAGREWINIPKVEFKWDEEGHLTLNESKVIRSSIDNRGGRTDWILFRQAVLDTQGFYQYSNQHSNSQALMTSPSQLCKWE